MTAHSTVAVAPSSSCASSPPEGATGQREGRGSIPPDKTARKLIRTLIRQQFARDPEFLQGTHALGPPWVSVPKADRRDLVDFVFLGGHDPHSPEDAFDRLRWGGQCVYVSTSWKQVVDAAQQFADWHGARGWAIERRPITIKTYPFPFRWLGFAKKLHYFTARKVMLVEPGQSSDRFTYHVYLEKNKEHATGRTPLVAAQEWTDGYDAVKQVPTVERVLARLKEKFPEADEETLRRRAKKFTEKIFPVFLTREAAILKLLQRDLPKQFRDRVPHVVEAEQDLKGYVHTLRMKWLRNGGKPLTQLEFAKQAAELLTALHDDAKVMHLDLRLDNVVITEKGVGFVDFGSAVRVGEAFPEASLLGSLFGEMMRTSQIQRMLGKMTEKGQVTSEEICNSYHRIDKAVDFFYLAVQINAPHTNPDFCGLIQYDPHSREAQALSQLTDDILRPADPEKARYTSAREILEGIRDIERTLRK
jgi:hypothetical protein